MRYWYKRMPERYGDDLSIDKSEGNKQTEQEKISVLIDIMKKYM